MATTFYDSTSGYWVRKIKTLTGRYRHIKLGRPEPGADPQLIPPDILALGERWQDEVIFEHKLEITPRADPSRIDLYARLEAYARQQAQQLKPLSLRKLRWVINRFTTFTRQRGVIYLDEVRAGVVKDFLDHELAVRKVALCTLKADLSMLGKCWSQAIRYEQYHGQNPIRAVCHDLPSSDTSSRPESLAADEIDALMTEIAYRKSRPFTKGPGAKLPQWLEDIVVVMLNTGLRVNAAVQLRFAWVEGGRLTVPREFSKSGKSYATLVNDKVRTILDRRRAELGPGADRVFPEPKGGAWVYSRLNYLARACVKKGTWKRDPGHYNHVLRHTFITESLKVGVPLIMVSKLAGHRSVAMTERYDQTTCDDAIQWGLDKGVRL